MNNKYNWDEEDIIYEEPVSKYNPNHDELGRFSSGSGGSKKVGAGGLLFHISSKQNRKYIEQNGLSGSSGKPVFFSEQPHVFDITDTDVYVVDTSGTKLSPDTKRLIDRARKSYSSETSIPSSKIRRLTGAELKAVHETHNSYNWNPDIIEKANPYHDELGRFTSGPGGKRSSSLPKKPRIRRKVKPKTLKEKQLAVMITEDDRASIMNWSGYLYHDINSHLRTRAQDGKGASPESMAYELQLAFDSCSVAVDKDLKVFRGITATQDQVVLWAQSVGQVISDAGFQSTTTNRGVAAQFNNPRFGSEKKQEVVMSIRVPKGTKVLDLGALEKKLDLPVVDEREILLRNGTKFRIVSVKFNVKEKDWTTVTSDYNDSLITIVEVEVVQ